MLCCCEVEGRLSCSRDDTGTGINAGSLLCSSALPEAYSCGICLHSMGATYKHAVTAAESQLRRHPANVEHLKRRDFLGELAVQSFKKNRLTQGGH